MDPFSEGLRYARRYARGYLRERFTDAQLVRLLDDLRAEGVPWASLGHCLVGHGSHGVIGLAASEAALPLGWRWLAQLGRAARFETLRRQAWRRFDGWDHLASTAYQNLGNGRARLSPLETDRLRGRRLRWIALAEIRRRERERGRPAPPQPGRMQMSAETGR